MAMPTRNLKMEGRIDFYINNKCALYVQILKYLNSMFSNKISFFTNIFYIQILKLWCKNKFNSLLS